jgi:hemerythrin-like metal-binding protein
MSLTIESLIDNQKKIADLIEFFNDAMNKRKCKDEVLELLHRVSYYTEDFFINEELFLKKYQVPSFQLHTNEHKQFVEKMMLFYKRLEENDPEICKDVISYLKEWYEKHILNSDVQIIEYIKKRNIE